MKNSTRFAAVCGTTLLVLALLLSLLFVAVETDHHCTGEHCTICHQLQTAQQLLGQAAAHRQAAVVTVWFCVVLAMALPVRTVLFASPVMLKVKLLN